MSELPFTPASEGDVATAILAAATDDTEKLRFVVGPDTELLAHMREASEENTMLGTTHGFLRQPHRLTLEDPVDQGSFRFEPSP